MVELKLVKVNGDTRNDLLNALSELASMDADFSGENGSEYLWKEAVGFKSNADYLLNAVKDMPTDEDVINAFISGWINSDSFYNSFKTDVTYNNGKAECIALAVCC